MTIARKRIVHEFLRHLHATIKSNLTHSGGNTVPTELILSKMQQREDSKNIRPKSKLPALNHLPVAIRNSKSGPEKIQALTESFEKIADSLSWHQRDGSGHSNFKRGHANAFIIGPNGLETYGDTIVGVSLLAPKVQYPDHKHLPEELYLAMSGGDWRQNKGPWQTPGPGGLIYNPGNVVHSMRAKSQPLLAIWCLWTELKKQTKE